MRRLQPPTSALRMAASLRLNPSSAIMAPSFLKFQTKELRIWTIQRNAESDEKPGSILYMENRFRSAGIEESEIVYMHVYPNRWVLVKHNLKYGRLVIL